MTTPTIQIKQEFDRKVERIRSDRDLSEEAKRRRIAEAQTDAAARYQEAIETQEREAAEKVARAQREVMRIRYPMAASDAEKASVRASYRGAYNDAYYATSFLDSAEERERELTRLLRRAELSGDPELADGVYHVALEQGADGVVESYLATRPQERKRYDALQAAREEAAAVEQELSGAKMFPLRAPSVTYVTESGNPGGGLEGAYAGGGPAA